MTTTTTITAAPRPEPPRGVQCQTCGNTGVVERMEPRYIGHGAGGEKVYSAVHKVLHRSVCPCRRGWNQRIGGDA